MKTVPHFTISSLDENLAAWCPTLPNWANSWQMEDRDVDLGEEIVALLRPFLIHLLEQKLTRRTFSRHRDNAWLFGGAIFRQVKFAPKLRGRAALELVRESVSALGGPLIYPPLSEREQDSVDVTCRLLHHFLENPAGERKTVSPDHAD